MKKLKKHVPVKSKKTSRRRIKRFKGGIDGGTVYGVLLLALVLGGAYMMLGNIDPNIASPDKGQPVIIQGPNDSSVHSNLQLKDFPGITLTPTPTPSPSPTPTPTPIPPSTGGGGGGGGSTCFIKGTKILMANNSEKNIEDVKPGDKVIGYDLAEKKLAVETVTEMDSPIRNDYYDVTLSDGTIIGVTDEHPLYTEEGGWRSINPKHTYEENHALLVNELSIGDKVLKNSGEYISIVSITHKNGPIQAYNLKGVKGYNDYFADGVLAHNKGGGGGTGSSGGSGL
jgi:hypothetical protein